MSSQHLDAELLRKTHVDHLLTPGGTVDTYLGRVVNVTALADGFEANVDTFADAVGTLTDDVAALVAPTDTTDDLDAAEAAVAAMQTDPTVVGDGSYQLGFMLILEETGDVIAYGAADSGDAVLAIGSSEGTKPQTHVIFIPTGSGITSLTCDSSLGQYDNPLADFDPAKMYVIYISRWVTSGGTHKFVVTGRVLT